MNVIYTFKAVFFILLLFAFNLKAQEKKEATILYNTQPVQAVIDVNTKSLDYIIKSDDNFMEGFRLVIPDYEKYLLEKGSIVQEDKTIALDNSSLDNTADTLIAITPTDTENSLKNNAISFIIFTPGQATLSDEAIRKLELVIDEYKISGRDITLKAISINDTDILSANRANAIKTYLKIRGIDTNAVSVSYLIGNHNNNNVLVEFKN